MSASEVARQPQLARTWSQDANGTFSIARGVFSGGTKSVSSPECASNRTLLDRCRLTLIYGDVAWDTPAKSCGVKLRSSTFHSP